ncbi:hypothetical protein [Aestuariivirga sp.]|uniref:hypothetical protein n=1 Tax=Aestuariivirga sp. TaxID=2650926 RepID=UPI003BABEFB8
MVVLKALSLLIAAFLSLMAFGLVMRQMQAVRVKAQSQPARPQRLRRLRQDPRTGVYYPEA